VRPALFVGVATFDVIQQVVEAPGRNEKVSSSAQLLAAGGPATNAAVTCAALGIPSTLVTAVGRSVLGAAIRADLAECGVELVDRAADPAALPPVSAIVVSAGGERSVVSPNGVLDVTDVDPVVLAIPGGTAPTVVLADGHYPRLALPVLRSLAGRSVRVLDGGSVKAATPDLLRCVEVAVVSEDFRPHGCRTDEDVLDSLGRAGVRYVAMTRGGRPVLYRWGDRVGEVDVPSVAVVDTLGAGDVFHGAFVAALVRHGAHPDTLGSLDERAVLSAAAGVAARSVRSFGTRAWMNANPW
jgi:sugar/nucleoside kinase (ribokinase family)